MFEEPETGETLRIDAGGFRSEYREQIEAFRDMLRRECFHCSIDYLPLDTSMQFDKALLEYLINRRARY